MQNIETKATELVNKVSAKADRFFEAYGKTINSKSEAKSLIKNFSNTSSDAIAEMSAELDHVIHKELIETGEKLLQDYQDKLTKFDDSIGDNKLDFDTVDLIKGALQNMRESAESWGADEFVSSTIDETGEVTYDTRTYHVKVGQEAEEIVVGSHEEKVGTKRVVVGSHQEKVGTRKVKNKQKSWWQFWKDSYVEENVYETVNEYEDQDVYKTVLDYKTIMRDVFEERTEKIEKFSVAVSKLQAGLVTELRKNLQQGVKSAQDYARTEIAEVKKQFAELFDDLDKQIVEKYNELNKCASDQEIKEKELKKNKDLLGWIEQCKAEMEGVLDI